MITLAQSNFDAVPADFIKWFFAILFVLVLVAAAAWGAFGRREKQSVKIDREDQPVDVRKSPKRYNHDATENRFTGLEKKTEEHGKEIGELWKTLRVDLPAMERRIQESGERRSKETHDRINNILSEVGELRGEVRATRTKQ